VLRVSLFGILSAFLVSAGAVAEPLTLEVEHATFGFDRRTGEPVVTVRLTEQAKLRFGQFTTDHVGKKIEFRVDGQSIMTPVLRTPILGGTLQIADKLDTERVRKLVERLSSGAKIEVEVRE
jgi:preprotein translocase subunit SecD